jgi:Domain of unknown function (DUF4258)
MSILSGLGATRVPNGWWLCRHSLDFSTWTSYPAKERRIGKGLCMSEGGYKQVEIIPLAHKKMAQRGILESWVRETLVAPEQVVEGHGGRQVAHKRMMMADKERLLRIVYEETETMLVVVTAYFTSAIARYWGKTP